MSIDRRTVMTGGVALGAAALAGAGVQEAAATPTFTPQVSPQAAEEAGPSDPLASPFLRNNVRFMTRTSNDQIEFIGLDHLPFTEHASIREAEHAVLGQDNPTAVHRRKLVFRGMSSKDQEDEIRRVYVDLMQSASDIVRYGKTDVVVLVGKDIAAAIGAPLKDERFVHYQGVYWPYVGPYHRFNNSYYGTGGHLEALVWTADHIGARDIIAIANCPVDPFITGVVSSGPNGTVRLHRRESPINHVVRMPTDVRIEA